MGIIDDVKVHLKRGYTWPHEGQWCDDLELLIAELQRLLGNPFEARSETLPGVPYPKDAPSVIWNNARLFDPDDELPVGWKVVGSPERITGYRDELGRVMVIPDSGPPIDDGFERQRKLLAMASVFDVGTPGVSSIPVTVERCRQRNGNILWAVRHGSYVFDRHNKNWQYEPKPSNRDDDFIDRCRFERLDDALEAARVAVEKG